MLSDQRLTGHVGSAQSDDFIDNSWSDRLNAEITGELAAVKEKSERGFGYDVVAFATAAEPGAMTWLSKEDADRLGITYEIVERDDIPLPFDRNALSSPPPTKRPPVAEAPKSGTAESVAEAVILHTGAEQLNLRVAPDPRSRDVLPDRVLPANAILSVDLSGCRVWIASGRGAKDADNLWCPATYRAQYQEYQGWANAFYLLTAENRRAACVLLPDAAGCEQQRQPGYGGPFTR